MILPNATQPSIVAGVLIRITSVAWIVARLISLKLWHLDRIFPVLSPISGLELPSEIHILLLILSLLALSLIIIKPHQPLLILAVLIFELLTCSLDLMRWQPWEFQYLLTFLVFLGCRNDDAKFIRLFSLIFIASYIYAGIHKISGSFLHSIWDQLILRRGFGLSHGLIAQPLMHYSGLLIGLLEISIGLGLLFSKKRKLFMIMAILMHILIAIFLSPMVLNHNSIVLPWNFAMAIMVWLTFRSDIMLFDLKFWRSRAAIAMVVVVGLLPMLNFFGRWDNYLSFNLYSGDVPRLMVCLHNNDVPAGIGEYCSTKPFKYCDQGQSINIDKWALEELKVPLYSEQRAFIRFKEQWQKRYPDSDATLISYSYPYKSANIQKI